MGDHKSQRGPRHWAMRKTIGDTLRHVFTWGAHVKTILGFLFSLKDSVIVMTSVRLCQRMQRCTFQAYHRNSGIFYKLRIKNSLESSTLSLSVGKWGRQVYQNIFQARRCIFDMLDCDYRHNTSSSNSSAQPSLLTLKTITSIPRCFAAELGADACAHAGFRKEHAHGFVCSEAFIFEWICLLR